MSLDPKPVFRRMIVAWYDSEIACFAIIFVMLCVLLFGISGISVTLENPLYRDHLWLPATLCLMAMILIVVSVYKLLKIYSEY